MTSTELALKRTLTDILEDELYNMHSTQGGHSHHCHSQGFNVPSKMKNVLELPLPLSFDDYMTGDINSDSNNSAGDYSWVSAPDLSSRSNLVDCCSEQEQGNQQHRYQDYKIFNKYADPSLTTTSTHKNMINNDTRSNSKISPTTSTTPVQKTVNLNSVMKFANPFNTLKTQLPYDVKVTNDFMDAGDSIYSPQSDDEIIGFDTSYNPKMYWPLQDNSVALSNEDARMIFDHEFAADDDDLSDDEEEEEDRRREIQRVPLEESYDMHRIKSNTQTRVFDSCNFVDSNVMHAGYQNDEGSLNVSSDFAVIDDEDEDDDMIDEDELYEPSYRNNRTESVVFNNVGSEENGKVKLESTPPVLPVTRYDKTHANKATTRRKLSSSANTPNPSVSSRRKASSSKKFYQSPSPQEHLASETPNGNEIYTCMITNAITKQPCSAQFSRSYDLTRHQNTIHAKKKAVFRCSECISLLGQEGYQKTFSRLDALTRHIKSKHEDLSLEQRQEVTKYAKENIGYVVG